MHTEQLWRCLLEGFTGETNGRYYQDGVRVPGPGQDETTARPKGAAEPEANPSPVASKKTDRRATEVIADDLKELGNNFGEGDDRDEVLARAEELVTTQKAAIKQNIDRLADERLKSVADVNLGVKPEQMQAAVPAAINYYRQGMQEVVDRLNEKIDATQEAFEGWADYLDGGEAPEEEPEDVFDEVRADLKEYAAGDFKKELLAAHDDGARRIAEDMREHWDTKAEQAALEVTDFEDEQDQADHAEHVNGQLEESGNPNRVFQENGDWVYGEPESDEVEESVRRRVRFLSSKLAARDLCEAAGFRPSCVQLKALALLPADADRQALLAEWR